jgi:hypothetical protein
MGMMTDEEIEVMALVSEWYKLAAGAQRIPDSLHFRFLALWVAFNGLYSLWFPRAHSDKAQVQSFGNWPPARAAHAKAVSGSDPAYREAIEILGEKGVFNFLTKETERVTDPNDLRQVVLLVYRVRCNLFHGRKAPSNPRDLLLVKAAHVIVSELMRRLLDLPSTEARGT